MSLKMKSLEGQNRPQTKPQLHECAQLILYLAPGSGMCRWGHVPSARPAVPYVAVDADLLLILTVMVFKVLIWTQHDPYTYHCRITRIFGAF